MASVTVNLHTYSEGPFSVILGSNVLLGATFDPDSIAQTLDHVVLRFAGVNAGRFTISLVGANNRFTTNFEEIGRIILTASDDETLEVMIANADMSEPYEWFPVNSAEVSAFGNHIRGLTDQTAMLTLTDDPLSQAYERVNGVYVPVTVYERINGSYVQVEVLERVGGTYVEAG